jgi:hypothetical protein
MMRSLLGDFIARKERHNAASDHIPLVALCVSGTRQTIQAALLCERRFIPGLIGGHPLIAFRVGCGVARDTLGVRADLSHTLGMRGRSLCVR